VKNVHHQCIELVQVNEGKFQKIVENSLVGMFLYKEFFIYANDTFVKMTGYSVEELSKMHPWDLAEKSAKTILKRFTQKVVCGESFTFVDEELNFLRKDGKKVAVKIVTEVTNYQGENVGIGMVVDISGLMKKNQMMMDVLIQALSQSDDMIFVTDIQGVIQYANKALMHTYGYREHEVLGNTPGMFRSNKHSHSFYQELWECLLSGNNYHGTIINRTKNKELIYVDTKITSVKDEQTGKIAYFVATARNITERMAEAEKFRILATEDPLTQVANRYQINFYFDEFIARTNRGGEIFSVLILDIDHFKMVNDNYGHAVGDTILKEFSKLVAENIRLVDKFGRWGGEEFVLLLDATEEHEAMRVAQKLRKLVATKLFDGCLHITVSIGVTQYRPYETKEQCLQRADMALYAAKNLGRNKAVFN
jgi:diguanylate cyclase (GGDEF)-like protein/PAS domain S-box-containing protein